VCDLRAVLGNTGSKKTSIQQKISSFATVQKPCAAASSSDSARAASVSIPSNNAQSNKVQTERLSKTSEKSKSGGMKKDGGSIHFGTLREFCSGSFRCSSVGVDIWSTRRRIGTANLRSSEAKSYPIVKGFEKQRKLPTISRQVGGHAHKISFPTDQNPRNQSTGPSRPTDPINSKRSRDLSISDADAIEYLSPKRLGMTSRQGRGEQSYADTPKCLSGQQKLQKYRLVEGNIATGTAEGNSFSIDEQDMDTTGGGFNADFQIAKADDCATALETEVHDNTRLPYHTIFDVPDDDFGRQETSSETTRCEGDYVCPPNSDQRLIMHPSHPYIISREPSSPSPVRSFPRTEMLRTKQHSAQSFGMSTTPKLLGSTAPSKIIGPSEGITRRAFEVARGKAQDHQQDDSNQGRQNL